MPLDNPALCGTEKDGSASSNYCKYCYRDGAFINPGMTLDEMQKLCIEKMKEQHIPEDIIKSAMAMLPTLERWKTASQPQERTPSPGDMTVPEECLD
jgi:hypothetical protein